MSSDGTCIDVADTPPNEAAFSRPGTGRGEGAGAFPQVRLVGLAECGTHALTGAAIGACTSGKATLTRDLLGSLGEGMLVLADRNFYGFELWSEAAATGAQLLWRTKAGHVLPPGERLPDGSYLSHLRRFAGHRHRIIDTDVVVRGFDYRIDDPGRPQAERSRGGGPAPALLSLASPWGNGGDQACLVGENDRLYPVAQAELAEDPRHVRLDRRVAERQLCGEFRVGHAPGDQPEDLGFAGRAQRQIPPRRARPARPR